MSDAAPAATPAKVQKKKPAKAKKPADHPKYNAMIKEAIKALKERGGSSRQAILKYIVKNFNVGKEEKVVNQHLKMALRAGAKNGSLKQSKGTGASGSFRLGEVKTDKPKKAKKPKAVKPKKAKAPKKVKKAKPAGEKKAAKPKKAKTPKKAAKPKKAAAKPKKAAAKPKKAAAKPKKAAKAKKA